MKAYIKRCENCGNTFSSKRSHRKTCSTRCRTQLHYKKKFGNVIEKTFHTLSNKTLQDSNIETVSPTSLYNKDLYDNEKYENSKGKNVSTKNGLYDLSFDPPKRLNAYLEDNSDNYFVDEFYRQETIFSLLYKGITYHLIGYFNLDNQHIKRFHDEVASNSTDIILFETDLIDFEEIEDVVLIYVSERLVDYYINDFEMPEAYGYTHYC